MSNPITGNAGNPDDLRCYMRYGNAGQQYRICNTPHAGKKPAPRVAKFTKIMTPQEFSEEVGNPYSKMSASQKENYHRLGSAIAMREKRQEQSKQKEMNAKEYKEYLKSLGEGKARDKEQEQLLKKSERLLKDLKKELSGRGVNMSDEKEIKEFIKKNVNESDFNESAFRENAKRDLENRPSTYEAVLRERIKKGEKQLNKADSVIKLQSGQTKKLSTIIKDFGLNDTLLIQAGGDSTAGAIKNGNQIMNFLEKAKKLTYARQQKKYAEPLTDYDTYKTFFRKLMNPENDTLQGLTKLTKPLPRGSSEEEQKKVAKQRKQLQQIRGAIKENFLSDRAEGLKKLKGSLQEEAKNNLAFNESQEKDIDKNVEKAQKTADEFIPMKQDNLVREAVNQLEDFRNQARKNGFDEKWIQSNIRIGITRDGRISGDTERFNQKLINTKEIIENIEGLEPKIKLARELKRNRKKKK